MAIADPRAWLLAVARTVAPSPSTGTVAGSKGWWETYGGPAVTAALVTVVVGGALQYWFSLRKERSSALRELRIRALNEFYAPIKTLLAGNKVLKDALRAQFGAADGVKWNTLDHLDEIKANETATKLVEEILAINKKIGKILESKSGLDIGQSASVVDWEVHRRLLDRAFNGSGGVLKGPLTYFPKAFEDDIVSMHAQLVGAVKSSVGMKEE